MWSLLEFHSYWQQAGVGLLLVLGAALVGQWTFERLTHPKNSQHRLRPKGTLPFVYNTFQAATLSHRWLDWLVEQCELFEGKGFWTRIVGNPDTLTITSPELFEDVLKTNFEVFDKGPRVNDIFRDLLGAGIFGVDGVQWIHQRKTASNLFSLRSLRESMTETIQKHALLLTGIFDRLATSAQPIDVFKLLNRFTMETFAEIGFGVELGLLGSTEEHPFQASFDGAQRILMLRFMRPWWFWKTQRALGIGVEREMKQHIQAINDTVFGIIARALENRDSQPQSGKKDIVSLFLDNVSADSSNGLTQGGAFDPVLLRDIVVNFLIAGRDTTAQALSWFFYMLSQNPAVEKKICDELARKVPALYHDKATAPSMEQTSDLVYLEGALRETLRLHPSVPRNSKFANRDITLCDGTFVRKGESISISTYLLGRMTNVWGQDAGEFRPERWIDSESGKLIQVSAYKFPAFHAGPRMCLGMNLAMVEMKIVASMVLSKFHLELVPGQEITYDFSLTHPIKGELMMNVRPVVK